MVPLHLSQYIWVVWLAGFAAWGDFHTRKIPNWLTIPGFVIGLGLNCVAAGPDGLTRALWGTAAALLVYIPLFALRAMGAGDVKLMAALGATVGPENWIVLFLAASIVGGVFGLALALLRGRARSTFANTALIVGELARFRAPYAAHLELDVRNPTGLRLPHAVSIFCGVLAFVCLSAKALLHP